MAKKSAKQKKSSVARKPRVKSKAAGKSRTSLASLTTEQLSAELKRRQSELPKLEKQAAALRGELASLEARIAALSGGAVVAKQPQPKGSSSSSSSSSSSASSSSSSTTARAPRRRHGQPTLAEQIVSVLQATGTVMSPSEIGTAVQKQFAREVKPSFNVQVSSTLRALVDDGAVAQVERAQYAAKGAAVASAN